jgi:adenylate kinase family enzyme
MGSGITRIDLVGAPGVGKSTLLDELLRRRSGEDTWMTPDELRIAIAATESLKDARSIRGYIIAILLNIRLFKRTHPFLSGIVLDKYCKLFLWENRDQESALDQLIKNIASSPYPANIKLIRYGWFLERSRQVALLQNLATRKTTVVFDDSLAQLLISLGPWSSDEALDNLNAFYNVLGELSAVIFLDADDRVVLDRLEKRKNKRINTAHRGLNESELATETRKNLESARQLVDLIGEKGALVIRVNAADPLDEQVRLVQESLRRGIEEWQKG